MAEETPDDPRQVSLTFDSPSLAKGTSPGSGEGELAILLPPSYLSSPNRRYPVVYALHGYGDNVDQLILAASPHLEGYAGPEFIMVGIYGDTSFYTDSPTHGDVARMVTEEVVPLIDRQYRTIPGPQGRLLAGFSMGGFAAWTIGLARPDLYSGVWASCPGAFDQTGLRDALGQLRSGLFNDYAVAFAPQYLDADGRAPLPRFDGTPADNAYVQALEAGFGNAEPRIAAYLAAPGRLKAVRFDYAIDDYFGWITNGTKALAGQFQAAGIPTTLVGWPSNHEITDDMVTQGLLPLARQLFQGL